MDIPKKDLSENKVLLDSDIPNSKFRVNGLLLLFYLITLFMTENLAHFS